MHALTRPLLATLCLASALTAGPQAHQPIEPVSRVRHLFVATSDGGSLGAALRVRGGPPWRVGTLAATDGGGRLRKFGGQVYVVHENAGTITRVAAKDAARSQVYDLGPASRPQDLHVHDPQAPSPLAYVTRREDPFLYGLDLITGRGVDLVDLSPVGGGAGIALGTMERDGALLFVQVRVFTGGAPAIEDDTGVLAVVDLLTHTLVDVDPIAAGTQGIALQGAPPRLKMQIVEETRTLFVSTTEGLLDNRGGIEMVDLDSLASVGFALSEQTIADLGGFVMTGPAEGFFVFHTDLLASTHLKRFTIDGGPDPGSEMLVLLGDTVDTLAYDRRLNRVFLPSGFSSNTRGVYAFDARTKQPIGGEPITTGLQPHDVITAR